MTQILTLPIPNSVKLRRGISKGNLWFCPCGERPTDCNHAHASTYCKSGFGYSRSQLCHCGHSLRPDIFDSEIAKVITTNNMGKVSLHPMDPFIDASALASDINNPSKLTILPFLAAGDYVNFMKENLEKASNNRIWLDPKSPRDTTCQYPTTSFVDRPATFAECGIDFSIIEMETHVTTQMNNQQVTGLSSSVPTITHQDTLPTTQVALHQGAVAVSTLSSATSNQTNTPVVGEHRASVTESSSAAAQQHISQVAMTFNNDFSTVEGRLGFINTLLAPSPFDLAAINNTFTLTDQQWSLIMRIFDFKDTQNIFKNDLAFDLLAAFPNEVADRLDELFKNKNQKQGQNEFLATAASKLSKIAELFLRVSPSNLNEQFALIEYLRQSLVDPNSNEDKATQISKGVAALLKEHNDRKKRQYFNNDNVWKGMLFYAWTVRVNSDSFDQNEYDKSITGVNKEECHSIKYYYWSRIRVNLIRKLKSSIQDVIYTIRGEKNNTNCSLKDSTKSKSSRKNGVQGGGTVAASTQHQAAMIPQTLPTNVSSSSGGSTTGSSSNDDESVEEDSDLDTTASQSVVNTSNRRRIHSEIEVGHIVDPSTKRFKKDWDRYWKTHPPLLIKPVNASDGRFKNASLLFFPLYLEALVSNPQQRVYSLAEKKPHHITCIIGINAGLIMEIACLARQHPLFANMGTLTYLVPTSIDTDDFVNDEDTDDEGDTASVLRNALLRTLDFQYYADIPVTYSKTDIRTITILSKKPMEPPKTVPTELNTTLRGVNQAMKASGGFEVPGGSHSTSDDSMISIAQLLQLKEADIVWDIGVGRPTMAFFFSMLTNTPVIGTDVDVRVIEWFKAYHAGSRR